MKLTKDLLGTFKEHEFFSNLIKYNSIPYFYETYKCVIPEDFMHKYADSLPFNEIIKYQHISEKFLSEHIDKFTPKTLCTYENLSANFIEQYAELLGWDIISSQKMSEDFMINNASILSWEKICKHNNELSIRVLEAVDNLGLLNWGVVSLTQNLSLEKCERFIDKINFYAMTDIHLPYSFIKDNIHKFNFDELIKSYPLAEDDLRKYARKIVNWHNLTLCQQLSESFIRDYYNFVSWKVISLEYKYLSEEFMLEYASMINWKDMFPLVVDRVSDDFKNKLIVKLSNK